MTSMDTTESGHGLTGGGRKTLAQIKARYSRLEEYEKRELALYRQYSGEEMAKEVAATNPSLVVDLGCGANLFKQFIPNLIGIDIVGRAGVDIVDDLHNAEKYIKEKADYIFNFGPLQYTDPEPQIAMMSRMLKDDGTIIAHCKEGNNGLTFENIHELGDKYGLRISRCQDSWTDTMNMTDEHWDIQWKIIVMHQLNLYEGRWVGKRLTWRWRKKI